MQDKKGIKVKTKQNSLVDDIVKLFKKDQGPEVHIQNQLLKNSSNDISNRSITPRKKIFQKTPQKAGKINFNSPHNIAPPTKVNKDIKTIEIFNSSLNSQKISDRMGKNKLEKPFKSNYHSQPMEDTRFNKLITTSTIKNINNNKISPQKTYLNDQFENTELSNKMISPQNINKASPQKINKISPQQTNKKSPVFQKMQELQSLSKMEKQLEHHKKLIHELKTQNAQLRIENQRMAQQLSNIKKQLKAYELTNQLYHKIQKSELDAPKSPFQKGYIFQETVSQEIALRGSFQSKKLEQKMANPMKQSIPILPETPKEYGHARQLPHIQEISFMSSNLKSLSHQNSILSAHSDFSQLPNQKKGPNKIKQKHNERQSKESPQLLSPFMQKTMYDKRTRPKEKNHNFINQKSVNEKISFSQTVGYLKGDQPKNSDEIFKRLSSGTNNNPFEEIATESNRFFFKEQSQGRQKNILNAVKGKQFPTREWLNFNQSQSSLKSEKRYQSNCVQYNRLSEKRDQSNCIQQNRFGQIEEGFKSNEVWRNNKIEDESKKDEHIGVKKDDSKLKISQQNLEIQKSKFKESKTYRFEDFDINAEDSSYSDFF